MVFLRFDGLNEGKKRPVLVIGTNGNMCSIAEISSQPPAYTSDVELVEWNMAGLDRESIVQTGKTRTVARDSLREYKGKLSGNDIRRVKYVMNNHR